MAVEKYNFSLLSLKDCPVQVAPSELIDLLKVWRRHHSFNHICTECRKPLEFKHTCYTICCQRFYYDDASPSYSVASIAVPTPGYVFNLPVLRRFIQRANLSTDQQFLILPDPIYWQMKSTLVYEKVMKFVQGLPMTRKTKTVHPVTKVNDFHKDILQAPLNYGSLQHRSCGKSTLFRQIAFGKRCVLSMRGMIVPDASLRPNEIRLPAKIVSQFQLLNKWLILNRMPSLQPSNFMGLYVASPGWDTDCIGIPVEIVVALNADFDGDECNIYLVPNTLSQVECSTILNSEFQLGCFVMQGPKLAPTQDMLVAYYHKYETIQFLPYKNPQLQTTFRVLYDLYGSRQTFRYIDEMRLFYLDVLQHEICNALTLEEMVTLYQWGQSSFDEFQHRAEKSNGCLVTQIKSGAKGSYAHLYQLFGKIGYQDGMCIEHSFWEGLDPVEAIAHAKLSTTALSKMCKIWEPGYSYSKMVFNLQGLHVDYKGQLMDGNTVIETDVLNCLHHTDLMSEEGFQYLLEKTLV